MRQKIQRHTKYTRLTSILLIILESLVKQASHAELGGGHPELASSIFSISPYLDALLWSGKHP